jgi:four helix bundle protein
MGVNDFTELVCWQLARELKLMVLPFADRPAVRQDYKFRSQLIDAASSATRNIAEGFGRYDHKEFAQFMKFALGSECETRDSLIDAFDKKYITKEEMDAGLKLARRAIAAATKFRHYLLTTPTPSPNSKLKKCDPRNEPESTDL